jgi:RNA polymerase sigma-70 factor (ECF subfamily)
MRIHSRRELGDDQIQALYQEHGPGLLLYACSLTGRRHTAEDVLHQVFVNLLKHKALPEEPKSYLFRAVHNVALNMLRGQSRDVDITDLGPWFEAPSQDQAEALALTQGIMQLPTEQRQVLVLHIWGGLTFEEIADFAAIPASTAASRYRYALEKLRVILSTGNSYAHS